jgi:uncharacterized OB-fold protein
MNEIQRNYPQAVETIDNAPYLQCWRQGKLMLQYCSHCSKSVFYPRAMCPDCWNPKLDWNEASGTGHVVSYSLISRPNHPAFNDEVPIALAEIMLDEGVAMLARILDVTPHTGMRVMLANDPATIARYPLPIFRCLT